MYSPEIALWRTVIVQAFLDASAKTEVANKYSTLHRRRDKIEARQWLTTDTPGLRAICSAAEIDHDLVIREAKRRAVAGWPIKRTAIGKEARNG